MREFEWDENKNKQNKQIRGLDFDQAKKLWEDPGIRVYAAKDVGEARFVAFGNLNATLHAVVFTLRGAKIRIISARVASRKERELYGKA